MNVKILKPVTVFICSVLTLTAIAQKDSPAATITASDLESHVSFLASPLLMGRMNGEKSLDIAAEYIASQAKLAGLKPANGNSYFQPYTLGREINDRDKSEVKIISGDSRNTEISKAPLYCVSPYGPSNISFEGDVVFAGYGIKSDNNNYNDFVNIDTEGKILLIMDRAPTSDDGTCRFNNPEWIAENNIRMKYSSIMLSKAKAVLVVPDPKSGFRSLAESNPQLAGYTGARIFNGEKPESYQGSSPNIIFIHRNLADNILKGTGLSLEYLQNGIDQNMKSYSFAINKKIAVNIVTKEESMPMKNVAGYIEGSDPLLKNEVVVFSGHYDHVGGYGDKIYTGADDNASGCAALLEIAQAFQLSKTKPRRTILFLWVSGEEIGLHGSAAYTRNPLFPLENTVVDLNMDMIGRVKTPADTGDDNPMSGPGTVFLITDNQSSELSAIAKQVDNRTDLDFDYSLSGPNHPLQLFARSDHYNFVKHDIPAIFFSSGLHTDYHTTRDVIGLLDFGKMEAVSRAMYEIGLEVANRKARIAVDNPFSKWGSRNR
ncbi:MAG: M20/M25/M40 family metallo-hydrolase [Bacteroidales bacterium]|jgi:hypothetical protein|nr:M20/M25/M40 family metallo-hydrolase [Bacteroidales bacterium]